METIKNSSGSKLVNIQKNDSMYIAFYCQTYNNIEQVLETKQAAKKSTLVKWAQKKLS
jgi:hypothetical protein